MNSYKILLLALLAILCGCSTKVAFTKQDINKYNLTPSRIKNLQFVTSDEIVLDRKKDAVVKVQNGRLIRETDRADYDRLVIREGTRCLVSEVNDDSLLVNFEADPTRSLYFVHDSSNAGKYVLGTTCDNKDQVVYGDDLFTITEGDAYLEYYRSSKKIGKTEKVVPGRKLPQFSLFNRAVHKGVHKNVEKTAVIGSSPNTPDPAR